jgi:hypothetical protein
MTTRISIPGTGANLPISSFRIGGVRRPDVVLNDVRVSMEINKHDSALLVTKMATTAAEDLEGEVISFDLGSNPSFRFSGYIYRVEKAQKLQSQIVVRLICIGATAVAKSPVFGLMLNVTAEQIADRVLPAVGLGYYSPGSSAVFPRFGLTGRSAWDCIRESAALGRRSVASLNGALWLVEPRKELERRAALAQFRKSIDVYGSGDRTLLDFTPGSARPKVNNPDLPQAAWFASDGSIQTESPSGDNTFWMNDRFLPTTDFAKEVFKAAYGKFRMGQSAVARVKGYTQVIPGVVVDVSTGLVASLSDTYDGLWFVTKVDHRVTDGSFQTEMSLIRDEYRQRNPRVTYEPFYERASRPYPTMTISDSGDWKSSWRNRV